MVKNLSIRLAVVLLASVFSVSAYAQAKTKSATVEVTASVESNCEISANSLNFGVYDPRNQADTLANSAITLTCVKNTPITGVELSGLNSNGGRQMKDGSNTLNYQVYKAADTAGTPCSASSTSVWGVLTDALNPGIAPDSSAKIYNMCGVIPAQQDVAVGNYKDTLTATVSY